MPLNFPHDQPQQPNDLFEGMPLDKVTALRDLLMVYPEAADKPADRFYLTNPRAKR